MARQRKKSELHENTEVKDSSYAVLLLIQKDSKIELKARTGTLEAYETKAGKILKIKFPKSSLIYKMLEGRLMIKDNYLKDRLIAVEIDSKGNTVPLEGKKLVAFEKKCKIQNYHWVYLFKNSFGIK